MMHKIYKLPLVILCMFIFGCAERGSPAPVTNISSHQSSLQQKIKIKGNYHQVSKGETLYSIAFRANKDFRELAKINGIPKPYKIFVDQKLRLTALLQKEINVLKEPDKKDHITIKQQKSNRIAKKDLDPIKQPEYVQKQPIKKSQIKKTRYSNKVDWHWPTKGDVIRRFSNKDNGYQGILIANKRGTSVRAAADGIVVYAGSALRGYGQLIIVKHNDDYLSAYAHNKRLLVKEKKEVKAGQTIAEMGSTDTKMTGLRFEIHYRGKSVNPVKYLPKH